MSGANLIAWANPLIGQPFAWGDTNCLQLALRAIDLQLGTALADTWRRQQSSARRAAAWTRSNGLAGAIEVLIEAGCKKIAPAYAADGDILLATGEDGQICAHVVLGHQVLSSRAESGVIVLPLAAVLPQATEALTCRP